MTATSWPVSCIQALQGCARPELVDGDDDRRRGAGRRDGFLNLNDHVRVLVDPPDAALIVGEEDFDAAVSVARHREFLVACCAGRGANANRRIPFFDRADLVGVLRDERQVGGAGRLGHHGDAPVLGETRGHDHPGAGGDGRPCGRPRPVGRDLSLLDQPSRRGIDADDHQPRQFEERHAWHVPGWRRMGG
ncbi:MULTISPECIES: hypothetical protein [unclassified Mesorhizobium]|uniref:hypothetical protein n=1 Tax=unclassified Mesorhizobium TaxID=325217 RepID=UPI0016724600|nr:MULTISPECIES: hypothetical protein [unclassified Mesorhizobium]